MAVLRETDLNNDDTQNRLLICLFTNQLPNFEKEMNKTKIQMQFTDLFTFISQENMRVCVNEFVIQREDESPSAIMEIDDEDKPISSFRQNSPVIIQDRSIAMHRQSITLCNMHFMLIGRPMLNAIIGISKHKRYSMIVYRLSFGMMLVCIFRRQDIVQNVLREIQGVCHIING